MRIICHSFDEFLQALRAELDAASRDCVFQHALRISVYPRNMDEHGVRQLINLQVSTIILLPDDAQYLLEVGVDCGIDYNDSTHEMNGTREAARLRAVLQDLCDDRGLKLLPGVIEP